MNGVVNIITKSPCEMKGTTFTIGGSAFDRTGGLADSDTGTRFYVSAAHAQVLNDRWAFKIRGGGLIQEAFARPQGSIPNACHTPYPPFKNWETRQPKVDVRVDCDFPDGKQHLTFAGGYASTGGFFIPAWARRAVRLSFRPPPYSTDTK
jgi:outer membrane receptor protein involved in Fe transport